jgi:hypothetical protein
MTVSHRPTTNRTGGFPVSGFPMWSRLSSRRVDGTFQFRDVALELAVGKLFAIFNLPSSPFPLRLCVFALNSCRFRVFRVFRG